MVGFVAALSPTRSAFYVAAVTAIPIFMLAIAVQLRARKIFELSAPRELVGGRLHLASRILGVLLAWASVSLLVVGEWMAISALYHDNDYGNGGVVFTAMIVGALCVFLGTADAVFRQMQAPLAEELDRVRNETESQPSLPERSSEPASDSTP